MNSNKHRHPVEVPEPHVVSQGTVISVDDDERQVFQARANQHEFQMLSRGQVEAIRSTGGLSFQRDTFSSRQCVSDAATVLGSMYLEIRKDKYATRVIGIQQSVEEADIIRRTHRIHMVSTDTKIGTDHRFVLPDLFEGCRS